MKTLLVIRNDAKEGAGQLGTLLNARGYQQETLFGWEADYTKLAMANYVALVILGGAQSAYDAEAYPYLADEVGLIQLFIAAEIPVIGICLGAQLLAQALGGEVNANNVMELGWHDIRITLEGKQDYLMSKHPDSAPAFHFHGDYFETPPACVNLASSSITGCQAYRYKDNVYGFQYHVEVDQPLLEIMCLNNVAYMLEHGVDVQAVVNASDEFISSYQETSADILNAWIDMLEVAS